VSGATETRGGSTDPATGVDATGAYPRRFDGKVCLVVGASQGMGRVTALAAARAGARVIVAARREDVLADLVREIRAAGGDADSHVVDARDAASVERLVGFVGERYGRLDLAFNNVGKQQGRAPLHEIPLARWQEAVAVNLSATFFCMKYEVPLMLASGGGSIVNNSSKAGLRGLPAMSDYSAVKSGVIGLTQAAALDYGRQGIRVNVIAPGMIRTEAAVTFEAQNPALVAKFRESGVSGRFGTMEEIAGVVLWLFGPESGYVNGAVIPVDGGDTAG
jgi:NAD(P)-dependent dehydrogenase (short-subunit alcohol dehydrogenase family)